MVMWGIQGEGRVIRFPDCWCPADVLAECHYHGSPGPYQVMVNDGTGWRSYWPEG